MRANFYYGETATSSSSLNLAISNTSINFGTITPGEPLVRTNTISITSPSGYEIIASENNPLKNSGGISIPDTTCDAGNCTQSTSALWLSPLTYGFGYRCDNLASSTDCSSSFNQGNYYMQFANTQGSETPQVVMSNTGSVANSQGQITYKLNISSSQVPGSYQNVIQYLAVPSL